MKLFKIFILFATFVAFTHTSNAQNPFENPKNLEVLPEDIPAERLRQIMRGFSFALGEQCSYCHDRVETDEGASMVWDTDNKDMKRVAREMMKLSGSINRDIAALNRGDDHQYTRVVCTTCHRGQANPFLIEQVMSEQIAEGGVEAARAKYADLKSKYYGGHTYDFTGFTLAEYANSLINANSLDNALDMAKFSVEQYPTETYAHTILGNVYMAQKNYAEAISAYEGSLALNPDQDGVINQIENAKKAMEE